MHRIRSPIITDSSRFRKSSTVNIQQMDNLVEEEAPEEEPPKSGRTNRSLSSGKEKLRPTTLVSIHGNSHGDSDTDEEDEDDDEFENERGSVLEGIYNPADYDHLAVSSEIRELFQLISRYAPQTIELDYKLKPFIPEFIPAVGDIDAFIKVTRPDKKEESLGLTVIDEPSLKQSDPSVLDLQLRAISKESTTKSITVKTLEDAEKNVKEIDKWIKSISDLHRSKPPPAVHYSRNMPSIDTLMQEWSPQVEELLKDISLPSADMDVNLAQYVDIACNILDIPVFNSRIQSLHLLFSLYLTFKKHQHFQNQRQQLESEDNAYGGETVDHLIL
ncbi:Intraflagellar transport protein 46 [Chamberlinius hualienensis]